MPRSLFFVLSLLVAPLNAKADRASATTPLWTCSLEISLTGEVEFFRLLGRDSWVGHGRMNCGCEGQVERPDVDLVFHSNAGDVGANSASNLFLTATFWTMTPPTLFQTMAVIVQAASDPFFHWEISSELTTGRATVWSPLSRTMRTALSQGTLWISPAVELGP